MPIRFARRDAREQRALQAQADHAFDSHVCRVHVGILMSDRAMGALKLTGVLLGCPRVAGDRRTAYPVRPWRQRLLALAVFSLLSTCLPPSFWVLGLHGEPLAPAIDEEPEVYPRNGFLQPAERVRKE